ncbi:MAG: methyltransferase domain-containing protein, partial [Erysipelotrichaceae bacterium]|nr:methyltransferase domain-containing protein [Erysipelotrichaceae bacterium]
MILLCPKCYKPLKKEEKVYRCENGHSYDIAREGYVNLVLANQKHSANPGDSPDSLASRAAFLSGGYYQPLADELVSVVGKYLKPSEKFLDAGCGTGYYLKNLADKLPFNLEYYGCDLAKKGVAMAAKAVREATLFVGNVFHLPFENGTLDGLMSVFCPYSAEEFSRVIRDGGYVIAVTPGKQHLYQIKQIVYEKPYYNQQSGYDLPD